MAAAQGAVIEAVKSHQQKMFEVIKSNHDGTSTMETLAGKNNHEKRLLLLSVIVRGHCEF